MIIDLAGEQGNFFSLFGMVSRFGNQMEMSKEQIKAIQEDMKSSDYNHAVEVFTEHFGHVVDIINAP